jgi:hypothetical protein
MKRIPVCVISQVVQAARRALFAATVAQRAAAYIVATLIVSVVGDFMPRSDNYMAMEDNVRATEICMCRYYSLWDRPSI